jgi:hypothetical protein
MVKNPYSSKQVGPLMRDVKNKICRDLDLGGLIEDDNGMELLVAGKIVKLDLPVSDVYEQVWARSAQGQGYGEGGAGSPMVVVYRLQGLDGEATEPIVDWAVRARVPLAVVPCCVFGRLFPDRRRRDGAPVTSYDDFVGYLRARVEDAGRDMCEMMMCARCHAWWPRYSSLPS